MYVSSMPFDRWHHLSLKQRLIQYSCK